jgi:hypothetical protein
LTGSYGKDAVNNHLNFLEDDDNDTALFERLQQQVLQNCPNPERIGCPSPSILRAFVEDPAAVTPAELNDLHILKCAECTRDLMELRKNRESEQPLESASSRGRLRSVVHAAMVITILCGILVTAIIYRKGDLLGSRRSASKAVTLARTVDLSSYPATRGVEQPQQDHAISLPRATIDLDLILPYFSQPGRYGVMVAKERSAADAVASVAGTAETVGTRTELRVILNLHDLPPGKYYLGTIEQSNGESSFYLFDLD